MLPCSSILSNKKSALAIPSVSLNHPRTYSSYNLPSRQIQDYGRNSFNQNNEIEKSFDKGHVGREVDRFHDTLEENVLRLQDDRELHNNDNFQHHEKKPTETLTNHDEVTSYAVPFHSQNLGHTVGPKQLSNSHHEIKIPIIFLFLKTPSIF